MTSGEIRAIAETCYAIPAAAAPLIGTQLDRTAPTELRERARQALLPLDLYGKVWVSEPGVLITRPGIIEPLDIGVSELAVAVVIGRMSRTPDRTESTRLARLITAVITESERIEHERTTRREVTA